MKLKLMVWILMGLLLLIGVGCEEDDLSAEEILMETIKASEDINATVFEMEIVQDIDMGEMGNFSTKVNVSGKAIEDPMAAEFDMEIETAGQKMDMKMYLADNLIYINIPEIGWVWEDISEDIPLLETFEDPFEFIGLLEFIDPESVTLGEADDNYLLSYTDDAGELANILKETAEAQLETDLFGASAADDPEMQEILSGIEFSDLVYTITIEDGTFLPLENTIAYQITMEMMDEIISMEQEINIGYIEFNTIDSIEVPDEVIDEAIPFKELF